MLVLVCGASPPGRRHAARLQVPRFRLGGGALLFGSFFLILMYFYFSLDISVTVLGVAGGNRGASGL